ncbi:protein LLP homolog isoform X2 [Ptychodera flava]
MAKSIRSKRKRKFRAIKREKIGKRELVKLKKMLGVNEDGTIDAEMKDICTAVTKPSRNGKKQDDSKIDVDTKAQGEKMEVDAKQNKDDSLSDEHGNYPVWMSRRKIKKIRDKKRKKIKYAW